MFNIMLTGIHLKRRMQIADGIISEFILSIRYQSTGYFDMELPSLNTGRWNHACSSYLDKYNVDVSVVLGSLAFPKQMFFFNISVYAQI